KGALALDVHVDVAIEVSDVQQPLDVIGRDLALRLEVSDAGAAAVLLGPCSGLRHRVPGRLRRVLLSHLGRRGLVLTWHVLLLVRLGYHVLSLPHARPPQIAISNLRPPSRPTVTPVPAATHAVSLPESGTLPAQEPCPGIPGTASAAANAFLIS